MRMVNCGGVAVSLYSGSDVTEPRRWGARVGVGPCCESLSKMVSREAGRCFWTASSLVRTRVDSEFPQFQLGSRWPPTPAGSDSEKLASLTHTTSAEYHYSKKKLPNYCGGLVGHNAFCICKPCLYYSSSPT